MSSENSYASAKLLNDLNAALVKAISALYPTATVTGAFDMPTDATKTNLVTNVAFALGKQVGKAPFDVATAIAEVLNAANLAAYFSFSAAKPGFVNVAFSDAFLRTLVADVTADPAHYGHNSMLAGQTWVIEHTSPNPNKSMHIGHLRNNLIGMALSRMVAMCGAKVVTEAVDNDRGIAIAKAMWGYLIFKKRDGARVEDVSFWFAHQDEWLKPSEVLAVDENGVSKEHTVKPDHFVGECYLQGSDDFKKSPASEQAVRDLVVRWEAHDAQVWKLWELVLGYAHEGINETLARLGNRWDKVWHEHEHYMQGRDYVLKGLAQGLFVKTDDGAILTDFARKDAEGALVYPAYKGIPDTILLKSDGTSLYITQDIALTKLKKEAYTSDSGKKADKLIWVIGPEQGVAMKQVFACCEQLGIGAMSDFAHVPYGLVNIVGEDGKVKKMSSRGGEAILIDDFIDEVRHSLLVAERGYEPEAAEAVAIAAIKYSLLRPSRMSDVIVDIKNATDLQGDSGVYLLYTYARMRSLLAKADPSIQPTGEYSAPERALAAALAYYPSVIRAVLKDYAPSAVVEYILGLSHDFNTWYAGEKFITEDAGVSARKLALTKSISLVFESALAALGMPVLEKM